MAREPGRAASPSAPGCPERTRECHPWRGQRIVAMTAGRRSVACLARLLATLNGVGALSG